MVYLLICNALADEKESFGTHKTWDIGRFICACVWIMSCNFSLDFSHSSYSMLANLFLHFFGFLLFFSFPPSSYSICVVIFYCSNRSFFSYLFVETFLLILLCFFLLSVSFIVWLYSPNIFLLFFFFFFFQFHFVLRFLVSWRKEHSYWKFKSIAYTSKNGASGSFGFLWMICCQLWYTIYTVHW